VAVDEQHKFGVAQRDFLLQRSPVPHLLNLSATPIPRTVALGLLGDINISTIKHKPTNRLPTKTYVISPTKFKDSPSWLIKELESGNQIFIVCPNITTHTGSVSSVEDTAKIYRKMIPAKFPLWSIHGKLDSAEQRKIIDQFKVTRGSLLVATSLIEVGIDIPEANIMIIHSAERFGLAQLHQLRGRVGRGEGQGYCFLVPSTEDDVEIERLQLLKKYDSGMTLAKKDLRLRGAGEVFGFKQHGALPTRLKYFWSKKLFTKAKAEARTLVEKDATLAASVATRLITW
jgi:ATP-dependent DNA helicase RecG